LKRLNGVEKCFLSTNKVKCSDVAEAMNFPFEFLQSLTPSGMPPHKLNLKIGAFMILLRNFNINNGLCNDTGMGIKNIMENIVDCEVISGGRIGERVYIPQDQSYFD
jgi:hypothetical protein